MGSISEVRLFNGTSILSAGISIGNLETGGMSGGGRGGGWITAWLIADQFQLHNLDEAQTLTVHPGKTHVNNVGFLKKIKINK